MTLNANDFSPGTIGYSPDEGFVVCGDDGVPVFIGFSFNPVAMVQSAVQTVSNVASSAVNTVSNAGKDAAKGLGSAASWVVARDPLAQTIKGIAQGQRLDQALVDGGKVAVQTMKELGPYAQTVLSFVPGVGTAVSMALAASIALANGEPITDIAIAAARGAVPGGAIAQAAFDTAASLARGTNVADAALEAARKQLPPAAQAAFDTGYALARGKRVQDAISAGGRGLLSPTAQQGFDSAVGMLNGKAPTDAILAAARQRLPPDAQLAFDAAVGVAKTGKPDALKTLATAALARATNGGGSPVLNQFLASARKLVPSSLPGGVADAVAKQAPALLAAANVVAKAMQGNVDAKTFIKNAYDGAVRQEPAATNIFRQLSLANDLQKKAVLTVPGQLRPDEVQRILILIRRAMNVLGASAP